MSENQIIKNNTFGLNLTVPKKNLEEVTKVVKQEVENISVNPFVEYFAENDKVFSGEVSSEIKKYQAQMYTLGQVIREDQPTRTFNFKM
jgi:fructose-1,6-bisphosphatase